MAAAGVVPIANTVVEVLNLYNYEDWSLRVETYLIAKDLWDVVTATPPIPIDDKDWRMKNAEALHAIQNSCRTDVFGFICDIRMAKYAWETLARRLKPKNRDIKGKAATLVPNVMMDLEALDRDSYALWSSLVKKYLLAEDLWDVVQGTSEPPAIVDGEVEAEYMVWRKNNARALHVITTFCGEKARNCISYVEGAKDAWKTLSAKFDPPEIIGTPAEDPEEDSEEDSKVESEAGSSSATHLVRDQEDGNDVHYTDFFKNVRHEEWDAVSEFIDIHPEAVRMKDQYTGLTALQHAVYFSKVKGVKMLLPLMKKKDLEIPADNVQNSRHGGKTALYMAIESYSFEIVKCMVQKNKKLLVRDVQPLASCIPLQMALNLDRREMVDYLYSVTPLKNLTTRNAAELVSTCLRTNRLDMLLDLLQRLPMLAIQKDESGQTPLNEFISTRTELFSDVKQLGICKQWIYRVAGWPVTDARHLPGIHGIYEMKLLDHQTFKILDLMYDVMNKDSLRYVQSKYVENALFQAVDRGHVSFFKFLLWRSSRDKCIGWFKTITNEDDKTLFQYAIEHRQVQICLLIRLSLHKKERTELIGRKDKFGNNMLHVVGKLHPWAKIAHIRGAALQMQYELQWFKKIESWASPKDLHCINYEGRTPYEEFTLNHRDLVKEGELSMKETATSSSALVAALIITIMFAAAVTVPGGINSDTGIPIYLHSKAFRIFIVADVISLCSATTSVMVFLGILTSRFAEQDFLTSLPTKLIVGFLTLFLSIGAMMIAFAAAISIMLPGQRSIVITSIVIACVPVASFLWMQYPYLREIIASTHGSGFQIHRGYDWWEWSMILEYWSQRVI